MSKSQVVFRGLFTPLRPVPRLIYVSVRLNYSINALTAAEAIPAADTALVYTRNSSIQLREGFQNLPNELSTRSWKRLSDSSHLLITDATKKVGKHVGKEGSAISETNEMAKWFSGTLRDCVLKGSLNEGRAVHGLVIKNGIDPDTHLWNSLVNVYAKCGSYSCALRVLDQMPERDVVSWTSLIAGLIADGHSSDGFKMFYEMRKEGIRPNEFTIATVLKGCSMCLDLDFGEQLHAEVIKSAAFSDFFVGSALVGLYAKCGEMEIANKVFFCMPEKNAVLWNSLLDGWAQLGDGKEVLKVFSNMTESELKFSKFTLSTVLKGCANSRDLRDARVVHSMAIKVGCELDEYVSCSLLNLYSKCGLADDALKVFGRIKDPSIVAWSEMINCLDQQGQSLEAAELFCQMKQKGVRPNQFTISSLISVATHLGDWHYGECIHACICKYGFESDNLIGNGLITFYMKNGFVQRGLQMFEAIHNHVSASRNGHSLNRLNESTWTMIIGNYAQTNQGKKTFKCFSQMQREGVKPNEFTLSSCLSGCSSLATPENGWQLHSLAIKTGMLGNIYVASALVDMYSKCRCIKDAEAVFKDIVEQNAVSWNTIICGYSQNGEGEKALKAFKLMLDEGTEPDEITFIGVLSACSHMGITEEGKKYFDSLSTVYGITPTIEHHACMVNILCRAGKFYEVENFIEEMKLIQNALIWETVLWGSKMHGNVEFGQKAAEKLFELVPEIDFNYILLSDLFAAKGRWDDVAKVRALMSSRNIKKEPGCSWVELDAQAHMFFAQDAPNPKIKEICLQLGELTRRQ